jgi:hypothetical protein
MRLLDVVADRLERFDAALEWDDEDDVLSAPSTSATATIVGPTGSTSAERCG